MNKPPLYKTHPPKEYKPVVIPEWSAFALFHQELQGHDVLENYTGRKLDKAGVFFRHQKALTAEPGAIKSMVQYLIVERHEIFVAREKKERHKLPPITFRKH